MGTDVRVGLGERGADAERLDALHRQLGDQLRSVDGLTVRVDTLEGAVPDGSRALDPATVSSLAVAVLGSGGLAALLASLRGWLGREHPRDPRTVRIEVAGDVLELTGASSTEQDRLVALFLARHEAVGSP